MPGFMKTLLSFPPSAPCVFKGENTEDGFQVLQPTLVIPFTNRSDYGGRILVAPSQGYT